MGRNTRNMAEHVPNYSDGHPRKPCNSKPRVRVPRTAFFFSPVFFFGKEKSPSPRCFQGERASVPKRAESGGKSWLKGLFFAAPPYVVGRCRKAVVMLFLCFFFSQTWSKHRAELMDILSEKAFLIIAALVHPGVELHLEHLVNVVVAMRRRRSDGSG